MVDIKLGVDSISPRLKKRKMTRFSVTFVGFVAFQVAAFVGLYKYRMHSRTRTDDTHKHPKYIVGQLTEWEKCMASSSEEESWQQPFLSFPPKRDISLEEAFRSKDTTIYLIHQRRNAGSSLSKILVDKYAELLENQTVEQYKSTGVAFGLKEKETEDESFSIESFAKEKGHEEAMKRTFAPCLLSLGCSHDELRVRENYSGDLKLIVGRHMTYHIPFARSVYEDQVLITNFRSPPARVESCIKFRDATLSRRVLDTKDFNVHDAERILLTRKDRNSSPSCLGEAFRMLTPFDPDVPVEPADVQKVCCYVKTGLHVVDFDKPKRDLTLIEAELMERLSREPEWKMQNKLIFSSRYQKNMDALIEHLKANNPVLQSEMQLYDCVQGDR